MTPVMSPTFASDEAMFLEGDPELQAQIVPEPPAAKDEDDDVPWPPPSLQTVGVHALWFFAGTSGKNFHMLCVL